MADEDTGAGEGQRQNPTVVVHERRGSGGMIVALIALVVVAVVAIWALNRNGDSADGNIAAAADQVGAAAEKVGNAADNASDRLTE